MIEEINNGCAVGAQADVSSLTNIVDVDQDRISILPSPSPDLRHAARETAEVRVSGVIARRQNMSMQIGRVENRDLNRVVVRCGGCACNSGGGAQKDGLTDRVEETAPLTATRTPFRSRDEMAPPFY